MTMNIADRLPPEIARQLHPDRRKNEASYGLVREQLLEEYRGLWVAFSDGRVIASGGSPVIVFHEGEASGLHPFFVRVGGEEEPSRIRRSVHAYDTSYGGEPMPVMAVEFRVAAGSPGTTLDGVIPDTGADASVLPWADCQQLQLTPAMGVQALISGVAGSMVATLAFRIWARLDGQDYPCRHQADFVGTDRLLGRDVMNRIDVLFCGPSGQIVINP